MSKPYIDLDREPDLRESSAFFAVLAVAVAIAIVSARDLAGGWNDGSRLATVESLVDYQTLAIDDSAFVKIRWPAAYYERPDAYQLVPWLIDQSRDDPFPYPLNYPKSWFGDGRHCETIGTRDKVLIGGHFYSHKPPVPALLMAPWYFVIERLGGVNARDRCDDFCYWMTLGSSGVSYVVALLCTFQLGRALGLSLGWRLVFVSSLGLSTVTVAYVRNVNDHILLLAVASGLALALAHLAHWARKRPVNANGPTKLVAAIGSLAGLAYTIDQATGPAMLLASAALVVYRLRQRWKMLAIFALAALPWLAVHHTINYWLGGTLTPIGSVPEFFDWPGSSFDRRNMTGFWNHKSLGDFAIYMRELTIVPLHGFFPHNLPLLVAVPGVFVLWRRRAAEWPELVWGTAWCVTSWLLYGALSSNYGGYCCSIRWFVPFLAVGYYFLAVLIRDDDRFRSGLLLFGGLGAAAAYFEWRQGPWLEPDAEWFQVLELVGLAVWPLWAIWTWWKGSSSTSQFRRSPVP